MLIFENGSTGRNATSQVPQNVADEVGLPSEFLRKRSADLPEVSELQAVRHFTNLSKKNFSIDTQFFPLGSCTMK